MQWLLSQVKGSVDNIITEADVLSSVRFNHDGSLLATGDKGGRVVVFKKSHQEKSSKPSKSTKYSDTNKLPSQYDVCCSFQSHVPEFDYLKSVDIEERINSIRWLPKINASDFLLTTNDKTIKLWKINEKTQKLCTKSHLNKASTDTTDNAIHHLLLPTHANTPPQTEASVRRVYQNAHTFHINSIATNSDQATFLSADDLRINLWHYQVSDQSFNIVDIKPNNMEDLSELITSADFHPFDCSTLAYSTSKGSVRLCDMRLRALCDQHCKTFEEAEDPSSRSFFSEIISSISHLSFSPTGRFIMTRDYLTLKVWDVRMEGAPVERHPVHEHLRARLCSLYEDQCIFDKFEASWAPYDRHVVTGSYNSFVRLFDRETGKEATFECSPLIKPLHTLKPRKMASAGRRARKDEVLVDSLDLSVKVMHSHWHPSEPLLALTSSPNLFLIAPKLP